MERVVRPRWYDTAGPRTIVGLDVDARQTHAAVLDLDTEQKSRRECRINTDATRWVIGA